MTHGTVIYGRSHSGEQAIGKTGVKTPEFPADYSMGFSVNCTVPWVMANPLHNDVRYVSGHTMPMPGDLAGLNRFKN